MPESTMRTRIRIEAPVRSVSPAPLSDVVLAIGRGDFVDHVYRLVRGLVRPDILGVYLIDANHGMRVLFADGGVPGVPDFPQIAARRYAGGYWKDDPAVGRLRGSAAIGGRSIMLRQRWYEIPAGEYRSFCYERPRMLERVSLYRSFTQGSILLSLYRQTESGHFSSYELGIIEQQADILGAATVRHLLLSRAQAALRPARETIGAELHTWNEKLSVREVEVCTALLREGSVKNAVRSLGMQISTFITYRKRAFAKLGIKTGDDLARVYEQRQIHPQTEDGA
jgi:LuxR family transcriptional regulator, activator of tox operons